MPWKEYRVGGRRFPDWQSAHEYAWDEERFEHPPKVEGVGVAHKIAGAFGTVVTWIIVFVAFSAVVTTCSPRWLWE